MQHFNTKGHQDILFYKIGGKQREREKNGGYCCAEKQIRENERRRY